MINELGKGDPYQSLCSANPYRSGVFNSNINGHLSYIEIDENRGTLLFERSFENASGERIRSGYFFIQRLTKFCEEEQLRKFRSLLETVVKERTKGNYMEIEPVLIAPGFSTEVKHFVLQYNSLQRRKPIQLYVYEV